MLRPYNLIPCSIGLAVAVPAMLAISIFSPLTSSAQTCRVSVGCNERGERAYIEAYEYDFVTDKPCYPGGDCQFMEFINRHRHYPEEAYKAGIQGRVTCSFIVNSNGAVSHIKVLRSVEETLNREAVRILSLMPCWTPGRLDGRPVPVRVIRSIPFRK